MIRVKEYFEECLERDPGTVGKFPDGNVFGECCCALALLASSLIGACVVIAATALRQLALQHMAASHASQWPAKPKSPTPAADVVVLGTRPKRASRHYTLTCF